VIVEAIRKAGYEPGQDFMIAIDAASSEWYREDTGLYHLPKSGRTLSRSQMVAQWKRYIKKYPILSLEDGMA
jgi:enolase